MKIFFYYRFDLTKKTPPGENVMGANCNVTLASSRSLQTQQNRVLLKRSTMLKSILLLL